MNNYIKKLSNINMFQEYNIDELKELFKASEYEIKEYGKGQIIHFQNEICSAMDIIIEGKVSVQRIEENGNVLTVGSFYDGDILGANLIFSKRNQYPMMIIATSKTKIIHIKSKLLLELCQHNINFMIKLMTEISDKTTILTEKINTLSFKSIRQYILDYLKYEQHIQNSNIIKLNMSKKDMAERLGVQRTSLSRELNKMRTDGLIEYDSTTITIKKI